MNRSRQKKLKTHLVENTYYLAGLFTARQFINKGFHAYTLVDDLRWIASYIPFPFLHLGIINLFRSTVDSLGLKPGSITSFCGLSQSPNLCVFSFFI